jgi:HEPN domain-containing protein
VWNWACFQAQQAGEKALKALLYRHGRTSVMTHSLRRLVRECEAVAKGATELDDDAVLLDQFYIPTRYPNGLDEDLPPSQYYVEKDAQRCLSSARSILDFVQGSLTS